MTEAFNHYQKWLGIPLKDQPADHYRLLGLEQFEADPDIIENAADRQMTYVRTFQTGQHAQLAEQLLNEISRAKVCLLNPVKKQSYDRRLRTYLKSRQAAAKASKAEPPQPAAKADPPQQVKYRRLVHVVMGAGAVVAAVVAMILSDDRGGQAERPVEQVEPVAAEVARQAAAEAPSAPVAPSRVDPSTQVAAHANDPPTAPSPRDDSTLPGATFTSTRPSERRNETDSVAKNPSQPRNPPKVSNLATLQFKKGERLGDLKLGHPLDYSREYHVVALSDLLHDLPLAGTQQYGQAAELEAVTTGTMFLLALPQHQSWVVKTLNGFSPVKTEFKCELLATSGRRIALDVYRFSISRGQSLVLPAVTPMPMVVAAESFKESAEIMQQRLLAQIRAKYPDADRDSDQRVTTSEAILYGEQLRQKHPQIDGDQDRSVSIAELAAFDIPAEEPVAAAATVEDEEELNELSEEMVERQPVPAEHEQIAVRKRITQLLEIDSTEEVAERVKIAQSLIDQAQRTSDKPLEQYVMLAMSAEVAASVGDLVKALHAADLIEQHFETGALDMRLQIMVDISDLPMPVEKKYALAQRSLPLVQKAIAEDKYDQARELVEWMISVTRRQVGDAALRKHVVEVRKSLIAAQREFNKIAPALETIQTDADDPKANGIVGSYLCFAKEKWSEGLPLLAKSDIPELRDLATKEAEDPQAWQEQVGLADGWFAFSGEQPRTYQGPIQARARHWYKLALDGALPLAQAKIQRRLQQIDEYAKELGYNVKMQPDVGLVTVAAGYQINVYVNGKRFLYGRTDDADEFLRGQRTFLPGDVIVVEAYRRSEDPDGFACVIQFRNSGRVIATGSTLSGWRCMRPELSRGSDGSYFVTGDWRTFKGDDEKIRLDHANALGSPFPYVQRVATLCRTPCKAITSSFTFNRNGGTSTGTLYYDYYYLKIE